jgi:hypothetical protein
MVRLARRTNNWKKEKDTRFFLFTIGDQAPRLPASDCRRGSIIEGERGQCIFYLPLKFTPGCVQRHCFQFHPPPPVTNVTYADKVYADRVWRGRVLVCVGFHVLPLALLLPQNCLTTARLQDKGWVPQTDKQLPQSTFAGYF